MSFSPSRGVRRRRTSALCAALVGMSGALVATGSAAAAPTPDCATAFPVADLTRGDAVTGLTVSAGTTPEEFTGEVLGVLKNGIGPGLDMIMMDLDSPAIDAAGGIWQGMSGSPVYAEDGRLIGAVAYGLAYGGSPIAGITPFEDMDGYLGDAAPAPNRIRVSDAQAKRIAASDAGVSRAQAEQGFRRLPMPTGYSGVDLDRAPTRDRAYIGNDDYRVGRASSADAADIDTVVAGGNIAAVESVGDITSAGIGTATSVCGDRVVAFGHPMTFAGKTSLGLGAADAIHIQEDPLNVPFKVANIGDIGGTITDDRLAGIAGTFGATPTAVPFVSDVSFGDAQRTGSTVVMVPDALPAIAYYGNIGNHDRVLDGMLAGSEVQEWVIKGTERGKPFTLRYADRYRSTTDIVGPGVYNLPDLLATLSRFTGVKITSVSNTAEVTERTTRFKIAGVQQKVGSKWVKVGNSVTAPAGKKLTLRVEVKGDGKTRNIAYSVAVPKSMAGRSGSLRILGGDSGYDDFYRGKDLAAVRKMLRTRPRNDQLSFDLRLGAGGAKVTGSAVQPAVVAGSKSLRINVR